MTTATFDTPAYSKKLQELGFTREQAEGFTQIQQDFIDEKLAAKADILALRTDLRDLEARMDTTIEKEDGERADFSFYTTLESADCAPALQAPQDPIQG